MPIKRKKNTGVRKIIIWIIIIVLIALMIVSFDTVQHTTEIVLFS